MLWKIVHVVDAFRQKRGGAWFRNREYLNSHRIAHFIAFRSERSFFDSTLYSTQSMKNTKRDVMQYVLVDDVGLHPPFG